MGVCKWCQTAKSKLAKSHIIPEAFFNYDGKTDRVLLAENKRGVRRPTGSYDQEILCQECESSYAKIDSDAAEILLNNFDKKIIPFNDTRDEEAIQISGEYRHSIKRFLIYVLWRASVSTLSEFDRVNLGVYEEKIKQDIISNKDFSTHEFSFWGCKMKKPSGHFLPYKDRQDGRTYYVMHLADYIFNVKVDSQITSQPYYEFADYKNVVFLKFEKTPDGQRRAMAEIAKKHDQSFGFVKGLRKKP